jgi:hypothetical protein
LGTDVINVTFGFREDDRSFNPIAVDNNVFHLEESMS